MTTEATDMETVKAAYMMANTHAAVWAGLGPVDPRLIDDLMTGILRAQAEQEAQRTAGASRSSRSD